MARGVLMYNVGKKMLARLYIAMKTLRDVWDGPACILAEQPHNPVKKWCKEWDIQFIPVEFSTPEGRKRTYLNACECHKFTPYDVTMWLDSDTMCLRDFSEMFDAAEEYEFAIAQFASWKTGGKIAKRIKAWKDTYPDKIEAALAFGPAINCGVFAFSSDSKLMADWHGLAIPGRSFSFIPDETCCQVILPEYPHKIMPHWFNCSAKYDKPRCVDTRIVHFHGNKHCRLRSKNEVDEIRKEYFRKQKEYSCKGKMPKDKMAELNRLDNNCTPILNHSDLWYLEFDKVRSKLEPYIQHDKQLRQNLPRWEELNA